MGDFWYYNYMCLVPRLRPALSKEPTRVDSSLSPFLLMRKADPASETLLVFNESKNLVKSLIRVFWHHSPSSTMQPAFCYIKHIYKNTGRHLDRQKDTFLKNFSCLQNLWIYSSDSHMWPDLFSVTHSALKLYLLISLTFLGPPASQKPITAAQEKGSCILLSYMYFKRVSVQ